ncbi:hypothetical protein RFI_38297 [Reticulomyxa filosa]|uniref:Uncharacterized protein n=1 Tax=Reticulomyxa filosa TaxID=46433 RepID=X6LCT0_RETFI|nr:hypothetical protein RFI_38297 [Reticulomyxa filosa]|eukprot:ETN99185.1 hypothetical protein RFI_38297 [Reticulomyxa filosa]
MAIYDLTSNGSIFPPTKRFLFTKAIIAKQPGIQYRDAEQLLQKQKGIVFETDFEDNDSDNDNNNDSDNDIQRSTLFFQNIVEAMGIDNAKMEEDEQKIACETTLLKKLIFEKRIIRYCFLDNERSFQLRKLFHLFHTRLLDFVDFFILIVYLAPLFKKFNYLLKIKLPQTQIRP